MRTSFLGLAVIAAIATPLAFASSANAAAPNGTIYAHDGSVIQYGGW